MMEIINPILVREIRQAVKSKAFLAMTGIVLLGMVITAFLFAQFYRGDGDGYGFNGRDAFGVAIGLLIPVVFFLVPFYALISMKEEVTGGVAELLMLSRLRPAQIVRGKLQSALVQVGIYVFLFSPLITTTYLLRGVSVPQVALVLLLLIESAILVVAFALFLGAFCRVATGTMVVMGVGVVSLVSITITGITFIGNELYWFLRDIYNWEMHIIWAVICLGGTVLLLQAASALITHPFENRSTRLRLSGFIGVLVAFGLVWLLAPPRGYKYAFPATGMVVLGFLVPFMLCCPTEERGFSPRTRLQIPRNWFLRLLALPFLPGGGRGASYCFMLILLCLVGSLGIPPVLGVKIGPRLVKTILVMSLWAVVFAHGAYLFRGLIGRGERKLWVYRFVYIVAFGVLHLVLGVFVANTVNHQDSVYMVYLVLGGMLAFIAGICSLPGMLNEIGECFANVPQSDPDGKKPTHLPTGEIGE